MKTDLQSKQKSKIAALINNPFGNSLAVLHLFVVALQYTGVISWLGLSVITSISLIINFPSYLITSFLSEIFLAFFSPNGKMIESYFTFYLLISSICIYLQWSLIGYAIEKRRKCE